ncbi:MAG: lytic transglycosylase domain-containing protein [Bacteroidaceae bacterium]|nr:lytic transglycosylase domain-containing protein [Bacteroidaceae bacterium]
MNKYTKIFILTAFLAISIPTLLHAQAAPTNYSTHDVPSSVTFCGKNINLTRYDRYERMDRELLAFTYMHSTSIQMIKKANRYFPIVEPILKANGIPDDFKYLMVIESNLNPNARSSAGAAGLWQFMQTTGREYGLEVNKNIDERYHVEKSTKAACKYLKDAYAKYQDWIAVAASYNAGQARISTQFEKQQVDDMLDLFLVEETARYVYRIIAAKIMFSNPSAFGFRLRTKDLYMPIPYKEVSVNTGILNLAEWAKKQGITYALLKNMNPWLRDNFLQNVSKRTYTIKIPTAEGMKHDPKKVKAHDKRWVVE